MSTNKERIEMSEHFLSKESTRMDLLNVLEHLRDDARDKAIGHAMFHTQHIDNSRRAEAMYYMGQIDLIGTLLWALDGTAEKDGVENPTVSIR